MNKHNQLWDLLPSEVQDTIDIRRGAKMDRWAEPTDRICWYDCDEISDEVAHAAIEHAARLHYEGEGYRFHPADTGNYEARHIRYSGSFWPSQRPLIDALLAAAEHARDGGEGD